MRSTSPGGRSWSCETITSAMSCWAPQSAEQGVELGPAVGVEPGERFVEHDRARLRREDAGQHDAAHLPAAQLVDAAPGETDRVETDRGQRGARRVVVDAAGGADLVEHRRPQHLQARVLERQPDPTDLIGDRPAVEQGRALARRDEAREDPRQRRLARTVVPDDDDRLARLDREVDAR